ncbi:MAG: cysteine desulfurase NifS [Anaerolineaceae bacterium]|nr:cysteine desulfurase NifS [Anaerolineaceae bacterium]
MDKHIYMDHAATTPVDASVLEAMLPWFTNEYGNPSSIHRWGQRTDYAITTAREEIAEILCCEADEIIFTSCGSESDNLALRGIALEARELGKGNHLIISSIEHPAILRTAQELEHHHGFDITILPVDQHGLISTTDLKNVIRPDTFLISIMYANNEIGVVQPISELTAIAHEHNILFHSDAVQAAGQLPLDIEKLGVDLLSVSAHKFYGPKGVGLLYAKRDTLKHSHQTGGSQENGLRAGTQNVPLIVGMARALTIVAARKSNDNSKMKVLRDKLIESVLDTIPDSILTGHRTCRLPNNASFAFEGIDGNELIMHLDLLNIAASSGSACKTGNPEPSSVLTALALSPKLSLGSLRLSLGRDTNDSDIEYIQQVLPKVINNMRGAL